MLNFETRRWVAVWYRCPVCKEEMGYPRLTPWKYIHSSLPHCYGLHCNDCAYEVVQARWYTTYAIDTGLNGTAVAGTLAEIGPFKVCDIVQPSMRAFKKWYSERKAEQAEQHRLYLEEWRRREAEGEARRQQRAQERALHQEAQRITWEQKYPAYALAGGDLDDIDESPF